MGKNEKTVSLMQPLNHSTESSIRQRIFPCADIILLTIIFAKMQFKIIIIKSIHSDMKKKKKKKKNSTKFTATCLLYLDHAFQGANHKPIQKYFQSKEM